MSGSEARSRLEQLDQVARRVLDEDLLPAGTGDDVVAERHAFGPQAGDLGVQVGRKEVNPVPPPGPGRAPSGVARPAELSGPLSSRRRLSRMTGTKRMMTDPSVRTRSASCRSRLLRRRRSPCSGQSSSCRFHERFLSLCLSDVNWAISNSTRASISSAVRTNAR